MRKLTLLLIFMAFSLPAFSQHFTVANTYANVIYVGLQNPVSLAMENYSADSVWLSHKEHPEWIGQGDNRGEFFITPLEYTSQTFDVLAKKIGQTKKIGSYTFRVKYPPAPVAEMGHDNKDSISLKQVRSVAGVVAVLYNFDYDCRYVLDGFTFSVKRNGKEIYSHANKGAAFDDDIKEHIGEVQLKDRILITKASATLKNNATKDLKEPIRHDLTPLDLIVVEAVPSDNWKEPEY